MQIADHFHESSFPNLKCSTIHSRELNYTYANWFCPRVHDTPGVVEDVQNAAQPLVIYQVLKRVSRNGVRYIGIW